MSERNPTLPHGASHQETNHSVSLCACYSIRTESVFAYAEAECISVRGASDSMMKGFPHGELNKVGAQVRRKLWPLIKRACRQLAKGEIEAIEVLNHWRGSIAMRSLYAPVDDSRLSTGCYFSIRVDIDGSLRWGEALISDQVTKRAYLAWSLTQHHSRSLHAVQSDLGLAGVLPETPNVSE